MILDGRRHAEHARRHRLRHSRAGRSGRAEGLTRSATTAALTLDVGPVELCRAGYSLTEPLERQRSRPARSGHVHRRDGDGLRRARSAARSASTTDDAEREPVQLRDHRRRGGRAGRYDRLRRLLDRPLRRRSNDVTGTPPRSRTAGPRSTRSATPGRRSTLRTPITAGHDLGVRLQERHAGRGPRHRVRYGPGLRAATTPSNSTARRLGAFRVSTTTRGPTTSHYDDSHRATLHGRVRLPVLHQRSRRQRPRRRELLLEREGLRVGGGPGGALRRRVCRERVRDKSAKRPRTMRRSWPSNCCWQRSTTRSRREPLGRPPLRSGRGTSTRRCPAIRGRPVECARGAGTGEEVPRATIPAALPDIGNRTARLQALVQGNSAGARNRLHGVGYQHDAVDVSLAQTALR